MYLKYVRRVVNKWQDHKIKKSLYSFTLAIENLLCKDYFPFLSWFVIKAETDGGNANETEL